MTPLTLILSDELLAFAERQAAALGLRSVGDYLGLLVQQARTQAAAARFEAMLLEGLTDSTGLSAAAQADLSRHLARYAAQPAVAVRLRAAVEAAAVEVGTPYEVQAPRLAGLHACPVKGFAEMHVYRLDSAVLRVLHRTRDLNV